MLAAFFSTFHILALVIGLPGVWVRGRALRSRDLPLLFKADAAWGVAAVLWLATGLTRVFVTEKGASGYASQPLFWVKMSLFGLVVLLELWPMITFVRWRIRQARSLEIDLGAVPALIRVNDIELGLTLLLPFVASMMARGL